MGEWMFSSLCYSVLFQASNERGRDPDPHTVDDDASLGRASPGTFRLGGTRMQLTGPVPLVVSRPAQAARGQLDLSAVCRAAEEAAERETSDQRAGPRQVGAGLAVALMFPA